MFGIEFQQPAKRPSIYNISPNSGLANTQWSNDQRIHQYDMQTRSYGGISQKVDLDYIDAPVWYPTAADAQGCGCEDPCDPNCPNYNVNAQANCSGVCSCYNGHPAQFIGGQQDGVYACDGSACDGCNSNCTNFDSEGCQPPGPGTCPESGLCDDFSPGVFPEDPCMYQGGCPADYTASNYCCYNATPIILDTEQQGFHLTDISHGVQFKFFPNRSSVKISWTDPRFSNGWLALDRNGNGSIDNATELFGNLTPQSPSPDRNGFLALAVFDERQNGGNGNGVIDPDDSVYNQLRVWIDVNHNGTSEPGELRTLRDIGVFRIDLRYLISKYVDASGNQFRYRGRVWDEAGRDHQACYDVNLQFEDAPIKK